MLPGRIACSLIWLLVLTLSPRLSATEPRVLLETNGHDVLARKVRAEGRHVGLNVTVVPTAPSTSQQLRARGSAVMAIRIISSDEVALLAAGSDEKALPVTTLQRRGDDEDAFAVRVVEHVRAHLVKLHLLPSRSDRVDSDTPEGSKKETAATAPTSRTAAVYSQRSPAPAADREPDSGAAARRPALWLSAGPAGTMAQGGLGRSLQLALGVRYELTRRWSTSASALLGLSQTEFKERRGSAESRVHLLALQAGYAPLTLGAWSFELGPGAGLAVLELSGEASRPYRGHEDVLVTSVLFVHAGVTHAPTDWLRLRMTTWGAISAPRPTIRFEEDRVASWGRLFGAALLTAELGVALDREEGTR